MKEAKDLAKLKETTDIKEARAIVANAQDLAAKIDKAVPLVGDDLTFTDFPPIQQQLLIGTTSPSGTNWSKPVEKAVAGEEIADASIAHLLSTLGVTVGAAFFILANVATGGLGDVPVRRRRGGERRAGCRELGQVPRPRHRPAGDGRPRAGARHRGAGRQRPRRRDPRLGLRRRRRLAGRQGREGGQSLRQGVEGPPRGRQGRRGGDLRAALKNLGKAGANDADIIAKAIVELARGGTQAHQHVV